MAERMALPETEVLSGAPLLAWKTTLPMIPRGAAHLHAHAAMRRPNPCARRGRWRLGRKAQRLLPRWRLCCSRSWSGPSSLSCPSRCRGSWSGSWPISRARSTGSEPGMSASRWTAVSLGRGKLGGRERRWGGSGNGAGPGLLRAEGAALPKGCAVAARPGARAEAAGLRLGCDRVGWGRAGCPFLRRAMSRSLLMRGGREGGRLGPDGSLLSSKRFQGVTWGLWGRGVRPLAEKGPWSRGACLLAGKGPFSWGLVGFFLSLLLGKRSLIFFFFFNFAKDYSGLKLHSKWG